LADLETSVLRVALSRMAEHPEPSPDEKESPCAAAQRGYEQNVDCRTMRSNDRHPRRYAKRRELRKPTSKTASVRDPSFAKAFLASLWINPDAGTGRLSHYCRASALYCRASALTFRAFTLRWIDDGLFHPSPSWPPHAPKTVIIRRRGALRIIAQALHQSGRDRPPYLAEEGWH
jgi:hypothetical protein